MRRTGITPDLRECTTRRVFPRLTLRKDEETPFVRNPSDSTICNQSIRFRQYIDERNFRNEPMQPRPHFGVSAGHSPKNQRLMILRPEPWLIGRMSVEMKTGQFRLMGILLMLAVLFASVTSSGCPLCDDLNVPGSHHPTLDTHDQKSPVPACDRDACSCCGLQFVTFASVLEFDLIKSAHVREFLQLSLPLGTISQLYRPPRV